MTDPTPNTRAWIINAEGWQVLSFKFDLTPVTVTPPPRDPANPLEDTQMISPFFTSLALLVEPDYDTNT